MIKIKTLLKKGFFVLPSTPQLDVCLIEMAKVMKYLLNEITKNWREISFPTGLDGMKHFPVSCAQEQIQLNKGIILRST